MSRIVRTFVPTDLSHVKCMLYYLGADVRHPAYLQFAPASLQ